jgi:hypothetical protein
VILFIIIFLCIPPVFLFLLTNSVFFSLKGGSALTLKMIYESVGILFYEVRLILLFLTASLDINGLIIMVVSQETIWKAAHGGW